MFAARFLAHLEPWADAFVQSRSHRRAIELVLGLLCAMGRRTVTRALCAQGRQGEDWSAAYRLFSRAQWDPADLFRPALANALGYVPGRFVAVAFDDTCTSKTGRRITNASWLRDPLSPAFRYNLRFGQRFLVGAVLLPLHRIDRLASARAIPVTFADAAVPRRPGRTAPPEQHEAYERARLDAQLPRTLVRQLRTLRAEMDRCQRHDQVLLAVVDGSFCNRTVLRADLERTDVLARARRDLALCLRATDSRRRFYGSERFTPEGVRTDETIPWQNVTITQSGHRWSMRIKALDEVYWRTGAGRRPLRLLVIAPQPHRVAGRIRYRDPGYLLTTDLTTDLAELVQAYVDRWQIEVVHRELKDTLGLGQAQLRSPQAVGRQPAMVAAAYAALHLAAVDLWGPGRSDDLLPGPKWYKRQRRPSCQELIALLRSQIAETRKIGASMTSAEWLRLLALTGAA